MEIPGAIQWLTEAINAKAYSMPALNSISAIRWIADLDDIQRKFLFTLVSTRTDPAGSVHDQFEQVWRPLLRFYDNKAIVSEHEYEPVHVKWGAHEKKPTAPDSVYLATGFREVAGSQHYHGLYACGRVYNKVMNRPDMTHHQVNVASARVQQTIARLNLVAPEKSPLDTLSKYLSTLLSAGPEVTSFLLQHFGTTAGSTGPIPPGSRIAIQVKNVNVWDQVYRGTCIYPWYACDVTAMIILALCAPSHRLAGFLQEPTLGTPNPLLLGTLNHGPSLCGAVPSTSLRGAYYHAKRSALYAQKTTLLMVTLSDAAQFTLLNPSLAEKYGIAIDESLPFSHSFVLAVDPKGWILYQSWKSFGPDLVEAMTSGATERRGWEEGDEFVRAFDAFARNDEKTFSYRKNQLYKKMFGMDMVDICRNPEIRKKAMMPFFQAWVSVSIVEDVQVRDVLKFDWRTDEGGAP